MIRWNHTATLMLAAGLLGCSASAERANYPATSQALGLERVVLYRNGVGYFERHGTVSKDELRIKVRKDQVNDLLKSLTVVDRKSGKVLSVSMPLDPQSWANAALATLRPGQGSLAEVIDALRGNHIELSTTRGQLKGRVVMVERIEQEPDPSVSVAPRHQAPAPLGRDHKVTLMNGTTMHVVRLSKVRSMQLSDGDLAMQFHRSLDATAGEGMFQQIDVSIRLSEASSHDLIVSYVVAAPMWKPTYRVVLPSDDKADALLQAWAVVDNTSGEDWRDVNLALTAGSPIAFRYDLHTPRKVQREDVTERVHRRRTRVAVGEMSFEEEESDGAGRAAPMPARPKAGSRHRRPRSKKSKRRRLKRRPAAPSRAEEMGGLGTSGFGRGGGGREGFGRLDSGRELSDHDLLSPLRSSTAAKTTAAKASGLTRFELGSRVTVPDGSSTMVAVINQPVKGHEAFLYKPGGGGQGYENNPYRVVRFKNDTPFALESGPISIYSGGSFVGEGISQSVSAGAQATIPFAVEPSIAVSKKRATAPEHVRLIKIERGIFHVERFRRIKTTWAVRNQPKKRDITVLIRHPKAGGIFSLKTKPKGMEEVKDGYLLPIKVATGKTSAKLEVVEQTPMKSRLTIWDSRSLKLLKTVLLDTEVDEGKKKVLRPIVDLRRALARIDTKIDGLKGQQRELDQRAEETRDNLRAMEKDKSAASAKLRRTLQKRLDGFTRDGDKLGRQIVELRSERLQKKIALQDKIRTLSFTAPKTVAKP